MAKTSVITVRQRIVDITEELLEHQGYAFASHIRRSHEKQYNLPICEGLVLITWRENGYDVSRDEFGDWFARPGLDA